MASDPIGEEELAPVVKCQECGGSGRYQNSATCRVCLGARRVRISRTALAELIRKREEAAWRRGFTAGRVYGVATITASEDDQIPLIQNPFAKGGE